MRRFRVVTGKRYIGVQGVPAELVARYIRNRAAASCYAHSGYVAPGWRMREWSTAASRERYRLAMVSDHCD